ncbi:hypothetical protein NPIL_234551 [Nephila pilipes]|uniref:Uncharacterized protein n=1 Tax=Nephila pilipes TaxID=299642 RepID=A0A8X6N130_NEPPI|nr:hypothetical protein NPIL_684211 [Nephila pilipes]GFS95310.1 hypothetical protein NPIL_234551 [Nephila pilipes]
MSHNLISQAFFCKSMDVKSVQGFPFSTRSKEFSKTGSQSTNRVVMYAIYRAEHLEPLSSLSADSLLLPQRYFVSRRRPRIINYDSGIHFKGSDNDILKLE